MISLIILFVFICAVRTAPHFPQNSEQNGIQREELINRRNVLQHGAPTHCSVEKMASVIGMRELQELMEAYATRKGISPFMVLSKLLTRIRNRQEVEKSFLNTLEGAALQELLNPAMDLPQKQMPPASSGSPYAVLPDMHTKTSVGEEPPLFIIPPLKSSQNTPHLLPPPDNSENIIPHDSPVPLGSHPHSGKVSHVPPPLFPLFSPSRALIPPPGAVVHVNSEQFMNAIPDVTVAVSPLMTLVEALKQAEIKYQDALGLDPNSDLISFTHIPSFNCFVISQVDDVRRNDSSVWKVTVTDREGQEVYDDICIPDGKNIPVKPGTIISLSYVPL